MSNFYVSPKEVDALKLAASFGKLCVIPLEHILVHNIALQFFMGECERTTPPPSLQKRLSWGNEVGPRCQIAWILYTKNNTAYRTDC